KGGAGGRRPGPGPRARAEGGNAEDAGTTAGGRERIPPRRASDPSSPPATDPLPVPPSPLPLEWASLVDVVVTAAVEAVVDGAFVVAVVSGVAAVLELEIDGWGVAVVGASVDDEPAPTVDLVPSS